MENILTGNNSPRVLFDMYVDSLRFNLILAAIELKVFNHLAEPRTAEAIAEAIHTHPQNTQLFLDGLAACDLLHKKEGAYWNAPIARDYLVESGPAYLGKLLSFKNLFLQLDYQDVIKTVTEGPLVVVGADDPGNEGIWAKVADEMADYQKAGAAQQITKIVSQLPEFKSFKSMLDLGGGAGIIGISVVSAHPTMQGIIYDRPVVVKVSQKYIREYNMENRVKTMSGDYLQDPIGDQYDFILASATLNFAKQDIDTVMNKIYNALNPGGVCMVVTDGLTHEKTKPEIMVLSWLPTVLTGQDMGIEQGFITDAMLRAGFKSVRSKTVDMPMGPMDVEIARK